MQRQAIIRLIEKKGKDRTIYLTTIPFSNYPRMSYVDNWRTVSLLNVDYKIGSKASALRLEKTLPCIIHKNQCAFVQGRTIFDAVRSINGHGGSI